MSNRFSASLNISSILDVNQPYAIEAQFDDQRGVYAETGIQIGMSVVDRGGNLYRVHSIISPSPLRLRLTYNDSNSPAVPLNGLGIIGEVATDIPVM